MDQYIILDSKIIAPGHILTDHVLFVKNGKIESLAPKERTHESYMENYPVIDGKGLFLSPGFTETHFHACGYEFTENDNPQSLSVMADFLSQKGINTFVPTLLYNPKAIKNLARQLSLSSRLRKRIPGLYVEGPFLDPEKKGGIGEEKIKPFSENLLKETLEAGQGFIKMMVVSPRIGKFDRVIEILEENGVIPCLGHTSVAYEELTAKTENMECFSITHLFNAMSPLHHREPGLPLLPFLSSKPYFEIVGDGIHVNRHMIKMCAEKLNMDKMILISDAFVSAGLDYGEYTIEGETYLSSEKGVTRKKDGVLCGSNCLAPELLRRFRSFTGKTMEEAIRTMTINPAKLLKTDSFQGSIEPGKNADLILIDKDFNLIKNLYQ